mmetsp:Transcript_54604/g.150305  ORF Transcript_54604/g.150305 Transcript_54604/m.150305 type:complete len:254 (-) Transcript_54604:4327-5088(-)
MAQHGRAPLLVAPLDLHPAAVVRHLDVGRVSLRAEAAHGRWEHGGRLDVEGRGPGALHLRAGERAVERRPLEPVHDKLSVRRVDLAVATPLGDPYHAETETGAVLIQAPFDTRRNRRIAPRQVALDRHPTGFILFLVLHSCRSAVAGRARASIPVGQGHRLLVGLAPPSAAHTASRRGARAPLPHAHDGYTLAVVAGVGRSKRRKAFATVRFREHHRTRPRCGRSRRLRGDSSCLFLRRTHPGGPGERGRRAA